MYSIVYNNVVIASGLTLAQARGFCAQFGNGCTPVLTRTRFTLLPVTPYMAWYALWHGYAVTHA